jgi:predicted Zn-dependent protease
MSDNTDNSNPAVNDAERNPQETKYFDLHVTGIGYLNRVREVPVKRAQSFLAVDISALHGDSEDVQYTRFDCRVSGSDAKAIIEHLMPIIADDNNKVLVGFKLGDLYVDTFTYQSGDKAGEIGVSLKSRLLRIDWVKVNGKPFDIAVRAAV